MNSFDIILVDVMLSVLNGFEVTRRLRWQNVRMPILLLTAGGKLRARARFLHAGREFGIAGETIAAIACIGAVLLVRTDRWRFGGYLLRCDRRRASRDLLRQLQLHRVRAATRSIRSRQSKGPYSGDT